MTILVADTCTERLIVGLRTDSKDLGMPPEDRWINIDSQGNHARDILPAIQELLETENPEVLGVALGPGSFTGVRIGLATAKGLAEGWRIPLVGLDNLRAMAQGWAALVPGSPAAVLPVVDARKKKFYGALYSDGRELVPPADLEPDTWVTEVRNVWAGPVVLSGYQGALLATALGGRLPPDWSVLETRDWTPGLLDQAARAYGAGRFLDPGAGPRYLRLSEAEENLRSRTV